MARKKKPQANPDIDAFVGAVGMSANQIVAYNLAQARSWRGLTQEQAAEVIEPYLGVRWSKASVSQAERSVDGNFVRNFSADEVVAFAQAFDVPVTWFFMPPPPRVQPGVDIYLTDRDGNSPQPLSTLIDLVFGTQTQQAELTMRLQGWLQLATPDTLTDAQHQVTALVTRRVETLLRTSFRQLQQWQTSLRSIANQLETLEVAAKHAVAGDADIEVTELGGTDTPGLLTAAHDSADRTAQRDMTRQETASAAAKTGRTKAQRKQGASRTDEPGAPGQRPARKTP